MKQDQWDKLVRIIDGELMPEPPAGFIIDSPWLPGWYGIDIMQYFSSERLWLEANLHAEKSFPDVMFLPGFWSEYAMCTEPSAFGARMTWTANDLPHAEKILKDITEVDSVREPNPKSDGLLPFVIGRLRDCQPEINRAGHDIRFAVIRGPLNIASFLMGSTEFLTAMMMYPDHTHRLLEKITQFSVNWVQYQKEMFPSIEGILLLDDIVGFIGDEECRNFAVPYLKRIFASIDARVKFFHNDAHGLVCTPHLAGIGVNLFNFSFEHSLGEIRELAGPGVALLGNLPPRDVLAAGTPEEVFEQTRKMTGSIEDKRGIIWSVGGGMPPGVSTENIKAFLQGLKNA